MAYLNFRLNSSNIKADVFLTKQGTDGSQAWSAPWRSATAVQADSWSAEVAIPLYLLATYGDIDRMKMALVRNQVSSVIDDYAIKVGEKRQKSTWPASLTVPHYSDYHAPLAGIEVKKVGVPFQPSFAREIFPPII